MAEKRSGRERTALVVITGPPAAGKTTLGERLAGELRLPLLAKDDVKLALYRALGAKDVAESRRLSAEHSQLGVRGPG